jgi:hypothetical protein
MPYVAVGDAQPPGEPAGAQRPGRRILLVGVPELGDALGGGRRPGAEGGELLADLPLIAVQFPGELPGLQPFTGSELPGPVVAFHLGGQPLRIDRAAGDRRLLMAAGSEMPLQPGELTGRRAAVAYGLVEDIQALGAVVLGA